MSLTEDLCLFAEWCSLISIRKKRYQKVQWEKVDVFSLHLRTLRAGWTDAAPGHPEISWPYWAQRQAQAIAPRRSRRR